MLGKKIDVYHLKMAVLTILASPTLVLLGSALAIATDVGRAIARATSVKCYMTYSPPPTVMATPTSL